MIRYASDMSQTAACEPAGRLRMRGAIVWNMPQVQGKLSDFSMEFMEGVGILLCGKDKFEQGNIYRVFWTWG